MFYVEPLEIRGVVDSEMVVKKHWVEFFRKAVQEMNYDSPIYKMLKRELGAMGYWKNKPRGRPDIEHMRKRQR